MFNNGRFEYNQYGGKQSPHNNIYSQPKTGRSADSDRRDIRVLEPQFPAQQDGDQLRSTHAQEAAESLRLITLAKENNLYIDPDRLDTLGMLHSIPSGESKIYYNQVQNVVYKVRNPFAKRAIKEIVPQEIVYEHIIHNLLFPETRYSLIGITEDHGEVRFVLSQTYFETLAPVSDRHIEKYMLNRGLIKEDAYFYGNAYLSITDIGQSSDNVFVDDNGNLLFIDPIIRLKRPAKEVIKYLEDHPFIASQMEHTGKSLLEKIRNLFKN